MSGKSSNRAIRERLKQARETLEEAEALYQQDFWRGTINRSYYAIDSIGNKMGTQKNAD